MPNPSQQEFNVQIEGNVNEPVTLRVHDILGRIIEVKEKVSANSSVKLGSNWRGGTYLIEASQGDHRTVLKVVKLN